MRIFYFASLKENLKTSHDEMIFDSPVKISTIKNELVQKYGEQYFPKIYCVR